MKITSKILIGYALLAISFLTGMAYANYTIPHCLLSKQDESWLQTASTLVICITVVPILLYASSLGNAGKKYMPLIVLIFFSSAPTFWTAMDRKHEIQIQNWEFKGTITNKFTSTNHAEKALTIGGVNYEGIPTHIWKRVKIGDTIIKKACSNIIQINDKEIHFKSQ